MHKRIRIKFCGMTSVADALYASDLGVDAIGLIFCDQSSRNVSLTIASEIAKAVPPFITRVGVVVNESSDVIHSILKSVSLDILQFHGQETPEFCRSFGIPYIKTLHIDAMEKQKQYSDAKGFLIDTYHETQPGGTGQVFNWDLIPTDITKPIILAGGLNADNIKQAIAKVRPYGVDVTTGIEKTKGIKDPIKMEKFIAAVMDYP